MREPRLFPEAAGGRARRRGVRPQGRAVVEATIRAHGFRLTLRLDSYEYPRVQTGSDANWVKGEVDVEAGSFTARQPITVVTNELEWFRDGLRELDAKLTGEAELVHLEDEVGLTVRLENGSGTLSGFVQDHVGPELRFGEIPIDQSLVRAALPQFEAVVEAFPIRGDPRG